MTAAPKLAMLRAMSRTPRTRDAGGGPAEKRRKARSGPRKRRGPRKVTARSIEAAALWYLARYGTSTAHFRRVLMNRVERSARAHGTDRADGEALVDKLIARYRDAGLLDDRAYATARARTLHGRGASTRILVAALRAKGVGTEDIDAAIASLRELCADPEMAAARNFARRRRLGPFRAAGERDRHAQRDLAALGRAGFSYRAARSVMVAKTPEDLEREDLQRD
ncbi:MAG: RecX family transcriptional regulator [Alphaproteobacteria bacterium]